MPAKDRYHIVTLPGDGIGLEVTAQAVGVLKVAAEKYGVVLELEEMDAWDPATHAPVFPVVAWGEDHSSGEPQRPPQVAAHDPLRCSPEDRVAEPSEPRILPLSQLSPHPTAGDEVAGSGHTLQLVVAQGLRGASDVGQAASEDDGVFNRLTRSLSHVRSHRVGGVTEQRHPTSPPVSPKAAIDDVVA